MCAPFYASSFRFRVRDHIQILEEILIFEEPRPVYCQGWLKWHSKKQLPYNEDGVLNARGLHFINVLDRTRVVQGFWVVLPLSVSTHYFDPSLSITIGIFL